MTCSQLVFTLPGVGYYLPFSFPHTRSAHSAAGYFSSVLCDVRHSVLLAAVWTGSCKLQHRLPVCSGIHLPGFARLYDAILPLLSIQNLPRGLRLFKTNILHNIRDWLHFVVPQPCSHPCFGGAHFLGRCAFLSREFIEGYCSYVCQYHPLCLWGVKFFAVANPCQQILPSCCSRYVGFWLCTVVVIWKINEQVHQSI